MARHRRPVRGRDPWQWAGALIVAALITVTGTILLSSPPQPGRYPPVTCWLWGPCG